MEIFRVSKLAYLRLKKMLVDCDINIKQSHWLQLLQFRSGFAARLKPYDGWRVFGWYPYARTEMLDYKIVSY